MKTQSRPTCTCTNCGEKGYYPSRHFAANRGWNFFWQKDNPDHQLLCPECNIKFMESSPSNKCLHGIEHKWIEVTQMDQIIEKFICLHCSAKKDGAKKRLLTREELEIKRISREGI